MKRVLCLRFCNWLVQRQQHLNSTDSDGRSTSRLAIHTAAPQAGAAAARSDSEQRDAAFVRDIFPSARSGATILGSSQAAWHQGVRPGLPLDLELTGWGVLIAGFVIQFLWDRSAIRGATFPRWYLPLRFLLTAVAVLCLGLTAFVRSSPTFSL